MTESEIQIEISKALRLSNICIPNVLMNGGQYEADLLYFNLKSKLLNEVEIKVTIADFRNDFKKRNYHNSPDIAYLHYAMPKQLYDDYEQEILTVIGDAGLILVSSNNIHFKRRAKKRKLVERLTENQIVKYMRIGCMKWINR